MSFDEPRDEYDELYDQCLSLRARLKQRDARIAEEKLKRPAGKDGFDTAVEQLVREQTR